MTVVQAKTIIVRGADRVRGFLRQPCGKSAREIASARERSCKGRGTFVVVSTGIVASGNRAANLASAPKFHAHIATENSTTKNLTRKNLANDSLDEKKVRQKRAGRLMFKPTGRIDALPSDRRQACYGQICTVRQR